MTAFSRNVAKVLRGTVIAQAIGMLALPLLSRLFPPEAFGNLQLFSTALTLGLVFVSMRYEVAILQASCHQEAAALLKLCCLITIVTSLLTALVCAALLIFFGPWDANTGTVLWLIAPGLLMGGLLQTLGYVAQRNKDFNLIARAKVSQVGIYIVVSIAIGAAAPIAGGLVAADVLARGAAAALISWWCISSGLHLRVSVFFREITAVAHSHRAMPKHAVLSGLVNAAGSAVTPIMLYSSYSAATLGQYALVERSLMFPVAMIVIAVAQVFSADLAEQIRSSSGHTNQTFRHLVFKMAKIGVLPALAVGFISPWLFPKLFGAEWAFAGNVGMLMAAPVFASFVAGPVNMAIVLAGRQKLQLRWELLRLLAMLLGWGAVVHFDLDEATAVALHAGIIVAMSALFLYMADRVLTKS